MERISCLLLFPSNKNIVNRLGAQPFVVTEWIEVASVWVDASDWSICHEMGGLKFVVVSSREVDQSTF